jgi:hypothetical protein
MEQLALSNSIRYQSFEGYSYDLNIELTDQELTVLEVLRSHRLKKALRVEDETPIEIFKTGAYGKAGGVAWPSKKMMGLSQCRLIDLSLARLYYLHELAHILVYPYENYLHDITFFAVNAILLLRAYDHDPLSLLKLSVYDLQDIELDGVLLNEHPDYQDRIDDQTLSAFNELPGLLRIVDYLEELARSQLTMEEIVDEIWLTENVLYEFS